MPYVSIHSTFHWHYEALHTGTETGFNESCMSSTRHADFAHWTTIRISRTVPGHCNAVQHAAQLQNEAVWRQSGPWIRIPDLHRIRIQGPVWRSSFNNLYSFSLYFNVWWCHGRLYKIIINCTKVALTYNHPQVNPSDMNGRLFKKSQRGQYIKCLNMPPAKTWYSNWFWAKQQFCYKNSCYK